MPSLWEENKKNWVKKILDPKILGSKKILRQKKMGPKKSGSKIIVGAEILAISYSDDSWNLTPWASNKEMVLYPEKVLCPEYSYSWIPKNFWARFFGTKKIFCCTKLWVPNKFWFQKLIGPENILVPKNIWSRKVFDPKNFEAKLC